MYMGRVGSSSESEIVRELHGARVVLTGLSATSGVDVVRAFADIKARLVIHTTDLSPEVTALIALVSQTASEIKLYTDPLADADAAGIVLGARVPIILTSRADSVMTRLASCAVAALVWRRQIWAAIRRRRHPGLAATG